jgi:hypothetical protein
MKSGNLNFLEHSGPLQASNGTALLLPLLLKKRFIVYKALLQLSCYTAVRSSKTCVFYMLFLTIVGNLKDTPQENGKVSVIT